MVLEPQSTPPSAPEPAEPPPPTPPNSRNGMAVAGFILGIVALGAWFLPICGGPVTILGLILSILGCRSEKRGLAITGVVLNVICLVLTIVNAIFGAFMAASGNHDLINRLMN